MLPGEADERQPERFGAALLFDERNQVGHQHRGLLASSAVAWTSSEPRDH